jgi:hypothetical protein
MAENKLNGSVELLARSIRDVFQDAMSITRENIKEDMASMKQDVAKNLSDMETRLNSHIDTTNNNMQAQFARQEEIISNLKS